VDTVSTLKKRTARQEADAEDALIQRILQTDYQSLREEYLSHGLDPDQAIATIDSAIERAKSSGATQQVQQAKLEVSIAETRLPLHASHRASTQAEIIALSSHRSPSSGEAMGPPRTAVRDRVRTLWPILSSRYAIASTALIIVGLVGLLFFLHDSWPPNRPDTYAMSKDAEMVVVWPATPQAGVALCNELRAGRVVCSFVQGRDQAQSILAVSVPRDKIADFCKKVEANGNVCESSFMALGPQGSPM
jgi:hypothetical protein